MIKSTQLQLDEIKELQEQFTKGNRPSLVVDVSQVWLTDQHKQYAGPYTGLKKKKKKEGGGFKFLIATTIIFSWISSK